jgi:hypothetical protein
MRKHTIFLVLCTCFSASAWSQDNDSEPLDAVPLPPEIPEAIQSGEPIEPEVTILQKEESTVEEYRLNGRLYMVKIIPAVGASYYLLDRDGDGMMEFRTSKLGDDVVVPQWVLFEW